MSAMAPVPKNSPLMTAWEAYKGTEDYANTRRWAKHDEHVDGSLWAAFSTGFQNAALTPEHQESWQADVNELAAARRVADAPQSETPPSGTAKVPVEHTMLMRHHFWRAYHSSAKQGHVLFQDAYRAMLAAAPSQSGNEEKSNG